VWPCTHSAARPSIIHSRSLTYAAVTGCVRNWGLHDRRLGAWCVTTTVGPANGSSSADISQRRLCSCRARASMGRKARYSGKMRIRRKSFMVACASAMHRTRSPKTSKSVHSVHPRNRTPPMTTARFSR
jgi:hypothetical protein